MSSKCAICLLSFRKYWIKLTPCKHFLHYKCFKSFLISLNNKIPQCIVCRSEIIGFKSLYKGEFRSHQSLNYNIKNFGITERKKELPLRVSTSKPIYQHNPNITKNQNRQRRRRELKRYYKSIGQYKKTFKISWNPFIKMRQLSKL